MNKKPGLLFSVYALAMIILASVFKFHLNGVNESTANATKNVAQYIFVCPATNKTWESIAQMFSIGKSFIYFGIAFIIIVLVFGWGWALYQNLLKDKFDVAPYKTPWGITKVVFWAVVICYVLMMTPNHFRTKITRKGGGHETVWVLCEQTAKDARALKLRVPQK